MKLIQKFENRINHIDRGRDCCNFITIEINLFPGVKGGAVS